MLVIGTGASGLRWLGREEKAWWVMAAHSSPGCRQACGIGCISFSQENCITAAYIYRMPARNPAIELSTFP